MQRRKKEEKAINTIPTYIDYQIYKKYKRDSQDALVKEVDSKVEWRNFEEEKKENLLYFMESFDFPDLEELKTSLVKSGEYKKSEIEEIIAGLKTLPEYK